jgi:CRISPR-associated protein Cmr1
MLFYERLEYNLEFITPAFIGGAFPEERAELRPSSFIGILRWWFRNLALTITGDVDAIYTLESELFGNTERAGRVWVRFEKFLSRNYIIFNNGDISLNLTYLGYGNFNFVDCSKHLNKYPKICKQNNFPFKGNVNIKAFIPERTRIKVIFLIPKIRKKLIESLLYVVSLLGSVGGRNRRGWGSFHLKKISGNFLNINTLEEAYTIFHEELTKHLKTHDLQPLQFIKVFKSNANKNNWFQVLQQIGLSYRNFRNSFKENKKNIVDFLLKTSSNEDEGEVIIYNRIWLGLPIFIVKKKTIKEKSKLKVI